MIPTKTKFVYGKYPDTHRVTNPDWTLISDALMTAFNQGGSVSLVSLEHDMDLFDIGEVYSLEFRAEAQKFILIAAIKSQAGGHSAISWWRETAPLPKSEQAFSSIGGEQWNSLWVLCDAAIALHVFKEVFDTGNLSKMSRLNMH